jgi:hypothetical protein
MLNGLTYAFENEIRTWKLAMRILFQSGDGDVVEFGK